MIISIQSNNFRFSFVFLLVFDELSKHSAFILSTTKTKFRYNGPFCNTDIPTCFWKMWFAEKNLKIADMIDFSDGIFCRRIFFAISRAVGHCGKSTKKPWFFLAHITLYSVLNSFFPSVTFLYSRKHKKSRGLLDVFRRNINVTLGRNWLNGNRRTAWRSG